MRVWADGDGISVGDVGFLVEYNYAMQGGRSVYRLEDRPPYTNQSHQPRLIGWCGSTNDVSVYGCGMAKCVRIAKNGRSLLESIEATEAVLEEFGYPELAET